MKHISYKLFTKKPTLFKLRILKKQIVKQHSFNSIIRKNTQDILTFKWTFTNNLFNNQRSLNYIPLNFFLNKNHNSLITLYPLNYFGLRIDSFIWRKLINNISPSLTLHYWSVNSISTLNTNIYLNSKLTSFNLTNINFSHIFDNTRLQNLWKTPSCFKVNTTFYKKTLLTKILLKSRKYRTFSVLTRYLPYINLVRLLRFFNNKKSITYFINLNEFMNTLLIRINSNYRFFKFSESLGFKQTRFKSNVFRGLPLLSIFNSNDNFISLTNNTFFKNNNNFFFPVNKSDKTYLSNTGLLLLDHFNLKSIINTPVLFKFIMTTNDIHSMFTNTFSLISSSLTKHSFNSRVNTFKNSNIYPSHSLNFNIKRKVLKVFSYNKFSPNITMWYYNTLIRFIENCSGKKCFLKFNPFIENCLTFSDVARCNLWSLRISTFQKILGPKIFLQESLRIMHLAIRFKDPTFFSNWIRGMLNRMSFWKYRLLFRYIKFAMRYLFWIYFPELNFKGLKLKLKGKISVAGNARTRTLVYKIGETGYSKLNNRVLSDFSLINTFTGVLGFKIWFFF